MITPRNERAARKIHPISDLADILAKLKSEGKVIVHCHGVYDLVHPGHIRHLAEAGSQGDILVVTITSDRHVNKGPGRPIFSQDLRAETLASLESVNFVAINDAMTAVAVIRELRPDVYVKGSDYTDAENDITGKITEEADAVSSVGGRIYFTDDITYSSSSLINENFRAFPPETEQWLRDFRERYSETDVLECLEVVSDLKVLVLGEAIIDEYVFCEGMSKAAKDPILAFLKQSREAFVGGSLAVANHLGDFCDTVEIVTFIGEFDHYDEFIRSELHTNVKWHPVVHNGAPTIRKTRFVDDHSGNKIFELYNMDDGPLDDDTEQALLAKIEELLPQFDVVIVPDYGHGMMTPAVVDLVTSGSKFLVVNTQINAGNKGFNTISKYPRADYVCLAGHEMEQETRIRSGNHAEQFPVLAKAIDCPCFTVTLGRAGMMHYRCDSGVHFSPALAPKVVDRVGAGDAVLAITGVLVAKSVQPEFITFIGNAAGAEMVSELGNRISLGKTSLAKHLVTLVK